MLKAPRDKKKKAKARKKPALLYEGGDEKFTRGIIRLKRNNEKLFGGKQNCLHAGHTGRKPRCRVCAQTLLICAGWYRKQLCARSFAQVGTEVGPEGK